MLLAGYAVVVGATLVVDRPQYGLAAAALAALGFLLVGLGLYPRLRTAIEFVIPPFGAEESGGKPILLMGEAIQPSAFFRKFICVIRVKKAWVLIACGAYSLLVFVLLGSSVSLSPYVRGGYFAWLLYAAILATMQVLVQTSQWYNEQKLLGRAKVTLGTLTSVSEDGRYRHVRYQFLDSGGNRWGGMQRDLVTWEPDHIVLIFYDESQPGENTSTRGFAFRSFAIHPAGATESLPGKREGEE